MAKFFGSSHFWFQDDQGGAETAISTGMGSETFLCLGVDESAAPPDGEDELLPMAA